MPNYLDKCFLFYLKYSCEMEWIYEGEDEDIDIDSNVIEKVELVRDIATQQAAELLEACICTIEEHFESICDIEFNKKHKSRDLWEHSLGIRPDGTKKECFEVGVTIFPNRRALIPWVWCRGQAEDKMINILGRGHKPSQKYNKWVPCVVALEEIKIPVPEDLKKRVKYDPMVDQVRQIFSSFTKQKAKKLIALSS